MYTYINLSKNACIEVQGLWTFRIHRLTRKSIIKKLNGTKYGQMDIITKFSSKIPTLIKTCVISKKTLSLLFQLFFLKPVKIIVDINLAKMTSTFSPV